MPLSSSRFVGPRYWVKRGLILKPYQVDRTTNEVKTLPEVVEQLPLKGGLIAFEVISTQKNCQIIIDTDIIT